MAYYALNTYDADVHISSFTGLQQYGDHMNGDVRYSPEEHNVETPAGVLQPSAAPEILAGEFNGKIETLARLYRRWYSGADSKEVLFAAVGGKIYYQIVGTGSWAALPYPSGVSSYSNNVWSCVSYEINPQGSSASVDVLLMSNALDGMIMVRGDNFTVSKVNTPKKFGVIERYAERIWGGAIPDDPDMLVYSAPFDPTDWEANAEHPEDGAGDISQPSWDGDSFTALRAFGNQLIAFKKTRVWRVMGTDPGEYTFREQFGGGAPFFNTLAVDTERILMADRDGLCVYDGLTVEPYYKGYICDLWREINVSAMNQMCGVLFQERYYLAVPLGNSTVNNALIILNKRDGTLLCERDIFIESFLATSDRLYATSSSLPGKVMMIQYDSWLTGRARGSATRWVTPWMDFGYKKIQKGGFDLYFLGEVQDDPVTISFSVQTEKKIKTKKYTIQPLSRIDRMNNKNHRQKKLHFGGTGRRFRLIIETANGVTAPWRLIGGVHMIVETDYD